MVKNPPANTGAIGDLGLIPGSGRSPGGGNGNPLQFSCLENPMDRGAWWAIVHGVTKNQMQLSWHSTHDAGGRWLLFPDPWWVLQSVKLPQNILSNSPRVPERLLWARPPFSLKTEETLGKVKFQEVNMLSQPANSWFTIGTQLCLSTQPQLVGNQDPRTGRGSAGQLPPPFCLSLSDK